jgi:hypothetical protein
VIHKKKRPRFSGAAQKNKQRKRRRDMRHIALCAPNHIKVRAVGVWCDRDFVHVPLSSVTSKAGALNHVDLCRSVSTIVDRFSHTAIMFTDVDGDNVGILRSFNVLVIDANLDGARGFGFYVIKADVNRFESQFSDLVTLVEGREKVLF